jgi:hypothetical protein
MTDTMLKAAATRLIRHLARANKTRKKALLPKPEDRQDVPF